MSLQPIRRRKTLLKLLSCFSQQHESVKNGHQYPRPNHGLDDKNTAEKLGPRPKDISDAVGDSKNLQY